ncbi:hypothetical protein ACU4GD_01905 [Cupriavidus basilensis]
MNVLQSAKRSLARWLIRAPLAGIQRRDPEPPARCGLESGEAVLRRGAPPALPAHEVQALVKGTEAAASSSVRRTGECLICLFL